MQPFITPCLFLILAACSCLASDQPIAPGLLEGHLTIISPGTVELAEAGSKSDSKTYGAYTLIVRSSDGKKEIARVIPDDNGDYHTALPPGDYVLDLERERSALVRAKSKRFSVASEHSVRVNMEIDTGVR